MKPADTTEHSWIGRRLLALIDQDPPIDGCTTLTEPQRAGGPPEGAGWQPSKARQMVSRGEELAPGRVAGERGCIFSRHHYTEGKSAAIAARKALLKASLEPVSHRLISGKQRSRAACQEQMQSTKAVKIRASPAEGSCNQARTKGEARPSKERTKINYISLRGNIGCQNQSKPWGQT